MNNKELLDKLREGVGSQKLDEEVAKALWLEEQLNGVPQGVTTSLDATESLMRERFWRVTEQGHDDGWSVWGQKKPGTIGESAHIFGPAAHACARCIVLLKALSDGEYR